MSSDGISRAIIRFPKTPLLLGVPRIIPVPLHKMVPSFHTEEKE